MIRTLAAVLCLALASLPVSATGAWASAAGAVPDAAGAWARDDGTARIDIAPCGDDLCAVNTWVKNPAGREKVGDRLVMTLREVSPSTYTGHAFDERRKRTYAMTLIMGQGRMKTRGCVLYGVLCKTAGWTRIK